MEQLLRSDLRIRRKFFFMKYTHTTLKKKKKKGIVGEMNTHAFICHAHFSRIEALNEVPLLKGKILFFFEAVCKVFHPSLGSEGGRCSSLLCNVPEG